jgi:hypothetical protein
MDNVSFELIINHLMEQLKTKDKRITELEQMIDKRLNSLEKHNSQQMNNIDKRVDSIITKNMKQVTDIQQKLFNKKCEEISLETQYENIVNEWLKSSCEWVDDVKVSDTESYAPTEFDILYLEFSEWCEVRNYKTLPRNKCMKLLNDHQAESKYGLYLGKRKSDKCKNGTLYDPLYNINVV